MARQSEGFGRRYGPWGVVAGAAVGLGRTWSDELARRGVNLVMIDHDGRVLTEAAEAVRNRFGVDVDAVELDLGAPDLVARLEPVLTGREVGLLICNAAKELIGRFHTTDLDELLDAISVSVAAPTILARLLLPPMVQRGRGGVIIMSSLQAAHGAAFMGSYSATKAYDLRLAEALWDEMREHGVDVLGIAAGTIDTPNYRAVGVTSGPPPVAPEYVARRGLDALGRRGPVLVPGRLFAATAPLTRALPPSLGVRAFSRLNRSMFPDL